MKYGVVLGLLIFLAWSVLALAQLWFTPLTGEVFFKFSITAGVLLAVTIIVTLVVKEYLAEKKLKENGFIDG